MGGTSGSVGIVHLVAVGLSGAFGCAGLESMQEGCQDAVISVCAYRGMVQVYMLGRDQCCCMSNFRV